MAQRDKRKAGTKAPISAHPVFPAIVALWFAALFGIGCLVLPTALIEKIVVGAGLPAIIDAAAPPIGFTARLIMGVAAGLLGAAAGLFVARKVVAAQTSPASPRRAPDVARTEKSAKRPIFATEELGEEGLGPVRDDWEDFSGTSAGEPDEDFEHENDEQGPLDGMPPKSRQTMPGRRRSLSVTDEGGRSEFLASVPLPGQEDIDLNEDLSHDDDVIDEEAVDTGAAEYAESIQIFTNPAPVETGPEVSHEMPFKAEPEAQPLNFGAPVTATSTPAFPAADTAEIAAIPAAGPVPPKEADMATHSTDPLLYNPFADRAAAETAEQHVDAEAAPFSNPVSAETSKTPVPAEDLAGLSMAELVDRFARSLEEKSGKEKLEEAAPLVFKRPQSAVPEDKFDEVTEGQSGPVPPEVSGEPAPRSIADVASAEPAFAAPQPAAASIEGGGSQSENHDAEAPAMPAFQDLAQTSGFAAGPFGQPFAETVDDDNFVPQALRPLDLSEFAPEHDEEDDSLTIAGLNLGEGGLARMFGKAVDPSAPFAPPQSGAETVPEPAPFGTPVAQPADQAPLDLTDEEPASEEDDENYSSLLSMKSALSGNREFVRIEDDEDAGDGGNHEPAVIFPGQNNAGNATTPPSATRPFDAPPSGSHRGPGLAAAVPTAPAIAKADPAETEQALRDALEKLQRMSGTG